MDWGKVVSTISGAAPLLGSLFGPAGTAVGTIASAGIKLVASALGVEPTQDAIADAIATDPAAALKLKEFEMTNMLELQKLTIQQLGMELTDVQNARQRQVEHEKATGKSDTTLYILAWTIIAGFFSLTLTLLYFSYSGKPITDQTGVLFMLMGTLSTAFGMVVGYFFGSSKGSADKSALLSQVASVKAGL